MKTIAIFVVVVSLIGTIFTTPVKAYADYFISGVVYDDNENPFQGEVYLTDERTHESLSTVSGQNGHYSFNLAGLGYGYQIGDLMTLKTSGYNLLQYSQQCKVNNLRGDINNMDIHLSRKEFPPPVHIYYDYPAGFEGIIDRSLNFQKVQDWTSIEVPDNITDIYTYITYQIHDEGGQTDYMQFTYGMNVTVTWQFTYRVLLQSNPDYVIGSQTDNGVYAINYGVPYHLDPQFNVTIPQTWIGMNQVILEYHIMTREIYSDGYFPPTGGYEQTINSNHIFFHYKA